MANEFSNGDICGVWIYVGDTQQPISKARTRRQSDDAIAEDMKTCFSQFKFTREQHMEHFCSII